MRAALVLNRSRAAMRTRTVVRRECGTVGRRELGEFFSVRRSRRAARSLLLEVDGNCQGRPPLVACCRRRHGLRRRRRSKIITLQYIISDRNNQDFIMTRSGGGHLPPPWNSKIMLNILTFILIKQFFH